MLPCDADVPAYEFKTDSSERIEILAGECEVKLAGEEELPITVPVKRSWSKGIAVMSVMKQSCIHFAT